MAAWYCDGGYFDPYTRDCTTVPQLKIPPEVRTLGMMHVVVPVVHRASWLAISCMHGWVGADPYGWTSMFRKTR
jgi:hypothetical protein